MAKRSKIKAPVRPDFITSDAGSFVTVCPITPKAQSLLNKYYPTSTYLGASLCVEHRYAYDVLQGMITDGMVLQRGEDGAIARTHRSLTHQPLS